MNNENKLVPDFRDETVQTYTETYTPDGGDEQTATYKIGTAHPIINGILDKFAWIKTHVAAVWWNKLAGVTLKDKIDTMDESIAQLNSNKINIKKYTIKRQFTANTDANNQITTNIDIDAKEIIGAIPIMRGGIDTGIFQASIRVPEISTNSFLVQVIPDVTQTYELDVFVFWR